MLDKKSKNLTLDSGQGHSYLILVGSTLPCPNAYKLCSRQGSSGRIRGKTICLPSSKGRHHYHLIQFPAVFRIPLKHVLLLSKSVMVARFQK